MRFKSLELIGFKSFADKTRFEFEPGVTAIVGPNGCGKSNVADAIRWVLGEQSARSLRGLRMEDVIFSGSDQRKPLGLAEVSLTLTGADESLPVEYHEVTVTRRVLRSGEGQYFINRNPCRLKDINELFMGTGIGLNAYSIIAQGQIDMILSTKPEDRRYIFEEAAGITRYKEKKRQALRKLESTEENLLRLSDIINEVRRQLASVERQAKRAMRAREIGDSLKTMEIQLCAKKLSGIDAAIAENEKAHSGAKEKEENARRKIDELEAAQEALRDRLLALDRELGSVHARRAGVAGSIEASRNKIEADTLMLREIEESEGRYRSEIEELEKNIGELRGEAEGMEASVREAGSECVEKRAGIEKEERVLLDIRKEAAGAEQGLRATRAELVETINSTARNRNDLASLKSRLRNALLRTTKLQVEERELGERIEGARRELDEKQALRGGLAEDVETQASRLHEAREELERARAGEAEISQRRLELEKRLSECESRLEMLLRFKESREGFEEGVREVLEASERGDADLGGILGAVVECISVPARYQKAIEAALGDALQHLVVKTGEDAYRALAFLEKGKAAFLPLDDLQEPFSPRLPETEGVEGAAIGLVHADPPFDKAARYLLAGTYIVPDAAAARDLARSCPPGVRLATLSGELIVSRGEIRKHGEKSSPSPLLSAPRDMDGLRERIAGLRAEQEEIKQLMGEARARCSRCAGAVSQAQDAVTRVEVALAEARTEESRAARELERRRAERQAAADEIVEIREQCRVDGKSEEELRKRIAEGERREADLQEALKALQSAFEKKVLEREAREKEITELRVALASVSARLKNIEGNYGRAKTDISRMEEALSRRREHLHRAGEKKKELAEEMESLRAGIESLLAEKDTTDTDAKEREEKKASLYEQQRQTDARLREEIDRLGRFKDEVSKKEIVLVEKRGERNRLVERIREQYGEDLGGVRIDSEIRDWAAVEEEVERLKARLKRLGPVNMVALEEHRELEERLGFLTEQEEDLISAKDSLQKAINRINTETTKMFSETFAAIREKFKGIFKELFGGGNADLILEEGVEVLEAGINIVARPPGKKAQNISLLSGGEKALTAISLLFAIFTVKPSPFCLLDEIDAPLDESNINRFLTMLERFLKQSQFIIVTHNKRTISMSDVMYGITMEESGVSKVVSIKFTHGHGDHAGWGKDSAERPSAFYERAKQTAPAGKE